ncbi:BMP family protein [Georgenia sp. AZ-5]|uniref:BMP family lipoprotein n=1 Tax=Georgenia sp. AZ-5 TaxID=3367526 RepID=UPI003754A19D
MKKSIYAAALATTVALTLAACGAAPEEEEPGGGEATGGAAEQVDYSACVVSDAGGWDDKSFNQSAYEGLMRAVDELGIEANDAESQSETEFGPNVDSMVQAGCDLTFGVGFLLEDAVQAAAEANPDTSFALIDSAFSEGEQQVDLENAKPILFNTAEAAFLAGYVAAGMTQTGTVGTFGGLQIPSVSIFMDGFADGVAAYNEDQGADVRLVGWDKEAQTGAFAGTFDDIAAGRQQADQLIAQGADIIMPVAGPVGQGAAQAAVESDGAVRIIGVDSDWYESTEYGEVVLTSVLKDISQAVFDTIEQGVNGEFSGEAYVGTLENEGVGLAPFHDFDSQVPQELKDRVAELQEEIVSGERTIETVNAPSA